MTRLMIGAVSGALVCGLLTAPLAHAQDLEPRAYSASPVGANFLIATFSHSSGDIIFDPTLPITDVQADVQGLAIGIGHSFNLFGRLGLAMGAVPYAFA